MRFKPNEVIFAPDTADMKINSQISDESVLKEIGHRLSRIRLNRNWTQQQLADRAGLGLRTVQRMESGEVATQLSGFIRICRALDILEKLDSLLPENAVSPIDLMKMQGKLRKRASGQKSETTQSKDKTWTWGEAE